VNPSLTITAMAERAMTKIPQAPGTNRRHLPEAARGWQADAAAPEPQSVAIAADGGTFH
jgi:hypothetical protein